MAALKYSRQRESIKEYLASTTRSSHRGHSISSCKRRVSTYQSGNCIPQSQSYWLIWEKSSKSRPRTAAIVLMALPNPHYHVLCTECGEVY